MLKKLGLFFYFVCSITFAKQTINLSSLDNPSSNNDDIPFESLQTFVDVFDVIKRNYVNEIDNRQLIDSAVRGMLSRLDPYSSYMTDEQYRNFDRESSGNFAGTGLVLDIKQGDIVVVSVLENSPASRAGIKTGDQINEINDRLIKNLSLDEITNLLNGNAGTQVKINIISNGTEKKLTLTREFVQITGISAKMLDSKFAYIKISQFQDKTHEILTKEIQSLEIKHNLEGLIIDLRNNPGGIVDSAVKSADLFLNEGTIVIISARGKENTELKAENGDILNNKPIIILINQGTASAAEIFTAALQDNNRALVAGNKSFGKATVQTVKTLYHGGAVKLTTAKYLTPKNKSIQYEGINPQIVLQSDENNKDFALHECINMLSAISLVNKNIENSKTK